MREALALRDTVALRTGAEFIRQSLKSLGHDEAADIGDFVDEFPANGEIDALAIDTLKTAAGKKDSPRRSRLRSSIVWATCSTAMERRAGYSGVARPPE